MWLQWRLKGDVTGQGPREVEQGLGKRGTESSLDKDMGGTGTQSGGQTQRGGKALDRIMLTETHPER